MKYLAYIFSLLMALLGTVALFSAVDSTRKEAPSLKSAAPEHSVVILPLSPSLKSVTPDIPTPVDNYPPLDSRTASPAISLSTVASYVESTQNAVWEPPISRPALTSPLLGNLAHQPFPREILDRQPKALSRPPLSYPTKAARRRVEGQVIISYLITAQGEVINPQIIDSKPSGYFEEEALKYVQSWHFEPAVYQGEAVAVQGRSTIEYHLP